MKNFLPLAIFALAALLRIGFISGVPPSPSLDEVSLGYNAYSLMETGRDEYGTSFPVLLRAYDDWRPALYVYLVMPFIRIFGLSVLAVRLPSFVLSMATVYALFLTGNIIGRKYLSFKNLGLIGAGILAVSPWHIYLSRLGHEVNLGLALVTLGAYFFLNGVLHNKGRSFIASGIMFGLSAHSYQSVKMVSPLLILLGVLLFRKELQKNIRSALIAVTVCALIALPAVIATASPQGLLRFEGSSAFSADSPEMIRAGSRYTDAVTRGDIFGRISSGRIVTHTSIFLRNFTAHFSPSWLFTGESREAHKVPGLGLLYLWEGPLLLLGLWVALSVTGFKNIALYLIGWVLFSIMPASITTQAPHAMRSFTLVVPLLLLESLGVWHIIRSVKKRVPLLSVGAALLVIISLSVFIRGYFVRFPREQSDSFQYAMKEAVSYALENQHRHASVEFYNQGNLYQSYMFYLYYSRLDPAFYQRSGGTVSGGFNEAHYIGKFAFGTLPRDPDHTKKDVLYFFDARDVPEHLRILAEFENLDGMPAIVAASL